MKGRGDIVHDVRGRMVQWNEMLGEGMAIPNVDDAGEGVWDDADEGFPPGTT